MAARTLADAEADYAAVHAAYLRALNLESYTIAGRSGQRSKSDILYDQMMKLNAEMKKLSSSASGGIKVFSGVAVDN